MNHASLITEYAIRPNQCVACDSLSKNFDAEHIGYDLFGLGIKVRVNQGNMVVARYAVS